MKDLAAEQRQRLAVGASRRSLEHRATDLAAEQRQRVAVGASRRIMTIWTGKPRSGDSGDACCCRFSTERRAVGLLSRDAWLLSAHKKTADAFTSAVSVYSVP